MDALMEVLFIVVVFGVGIVVWLDYEDNKEE
jgi:hypothetical protein